MSEGVKRQKIKSIILKQLLAYIYNNDNYDYYATYSVREELLWFRPNVLMQAAGGNADINPTVKLFVAETTNVKAPHGVFTAPSPLHYRYTGILYSGILSIGQLD